MIRPTFYIPEHFVLLLARGYDPTQVLELFDTYDRLQRLQRKDARRARRWRRPGTIAQVVELFPASGPAEGCDRQNLEAATSEESGAPAK